MPEPALAAPFEPGCGAFGAIRAWVEAQLGIRFDDEQASVLGRRLSMAFGGEETLRNIVERLRTGDAATIVRVAEAASTNHTFFFREPESFDALARVVVPHLPSHGDVRVWSAASSSGEEAYSLAMCMREVLPVPQRLRILGTDISQKQVRAAEAGIYDPGAVVNVPPRFRRLFSPTEGGAVQLAGEIMRPCVFRRMNLVSFPWPFARRFHVTFLRNVLYYFDPAVRLRIVDACYDATEPGGWLFVGLSEPMVDLVSRWTPKGAGMFRKEVER